jgi:Uma2 family endonuclease
LEATLTRHKLTVADYHKMADAGILTEDDRVELIEGEIIQMPPIGSQHAGTVNRLSRRLDRAIGDMGIVAVQNPITLGGHSQPQPDIAVLKPRTDYYAQSHPSPDDVLLLIEVADSSTEYERNVKLPLYARHGIPEVWVIDLREPGLEIHRDPGPDGYRHILRPEKGERVSPSLLPEVRFVAAELFAPGSGL